MSPDFDFSHSANWRTIAVTNCTINSTYPSTWVGGIIAWASLEENQRPPANMATSLFRFLWPSIARQPAIISTSIPTKLPSIRTFATTPSPNATLNQVLRVRSLSPSHSTYHIPRNISIHDSLPPSTPTYPIPSPNGKDLTNQSSRTKLNHQTPPCLRNAVNPSAPATPSPPLYPTCSARSRRACA